MYWFDLHIRGLENNNFIELDKGKCIAIVCSDLIYKTPNDKQTTTTKKENVLQKILYESFVVFIYSYLSCCDKKGD